VSVGAHDVLAEARGTPDAIVCRRARKIAHLSCRAVEALRSTGAVRAFDIAQHGGVVSRGSWPVGAPRDQ